ncbi:hypothetical protein EVG20_g5241 [Dentipellis fragilis]|uniref:Uncharacterized protein n=1 Tax=Dentipellis fragilis TaxID=205917 RepID=A0A4Y9YVU2_9AGAM|nr:hypothetical protein EVG20_g5241 [Dentipellis fragilis]
MGVLVHVHRGHLVPPQQHDALFLLSFFPLPPLHHLPSLPSTSTSKSRGHSYVASGDSRIPSSSLTMALAHLGLVCTSTFSFAHVAPSARICAHLIRIVLAPLRTLAYRTRPFSDNSVPFVWPSSTHAFAARIRVVARPRALIYAHSLAPSAPLYPSLPIWICAMYGHCICTLW